MAFFRQRSVDTRSCRRKVIFPRMSQIAINFDR
jgi:hypothetical protein